MDLAVVVEMLLQPLLVLSRACSFQAPLLVEPPLAFGLPKEPELTFFDLVSVLAGL